MLADIRAHLNVYGPKDWKHVQDAYPMIPERTFFRWVGEVREATRSNDPVMTRAQREQLDDAAHRARVHASKNIPAAPSPSYLASRGAEGDRNVDFLSEIRVIWSDILMLREFAMKQDPSGRWGIKNPGVFDASIKRRLDAMDSALRVMQEIWDLQKMEQFFDEIVSIIVEEVAIYPETQERIMRRLKTLNDRRGMTPHAEPLAD